jgi:hypothetical protein
MNRRTYHTPQFVGADTTTLRYRISVFFPRRYEKQIRKFITVEGNSLQKRGDEPERSVSRYFQYQIL